MLAKIIDKLVKMGKNLWRLRAALVGYGGEGQFGRWGTDGSGDDEIGKKTSLFSNALSWLESMKKMVLGRKRTYNFFQLSAWKLRRGA